MTTNPEWVWCSADHRGRDVRIDAWPYVKGERWNSVPTQGVAPPAIYVRRDAVEAETTALRRERDAATEHAAAFAEVSRIVGIAYEADGRPVVPGPTDVVLAEVSEILVAANQSRELKSERDSVRRERDALRLERDAVAREGWRACVLGVSIIRFWQAETKSRSGDQRGALALMNEAVALRDIFTADDKAAGKGVG